MLVRPISNAKLSIIAVVFASRDIMTSSSEWRAASTAQFFE